MALWFAISDQPFNTMLVVAQEVENGRKAATLQLSADGACRLSRLRGGKTLRLQQAFLPEGWPRSVTSDYLSELGGRLPLLGETTSASSAPGGPRGDQLALQTKAPLPPALPPRLPPSTRASPFQ